MLLKCCFTSTETVGLLGAGAQDSRKIRTDHVVKSNDSLHTHTHPPHAHIHTHTRTQTGTHKHTHTCTPSHTHTHTHMHTYTHARTHTHTHTHTLYSLIRVKEMLPKLNIPSTTYLFIALI